MRFLPLSLFAAATLTSSAPGQGSLTPTGAPAPSLKSLAQVEPRLPVQSLPGDASNQFIISAPGSYYLTGNITGEAGKVGIRILSSNVTLDLSGFALNGLPTSNHGIGINVGNVSADHIRIFNGTINGWGGRGIYSVGTAAVYDLQVSDVVISNCFAGVDVDTSNSSSLIRNVSVRGGVGGILLSATGSVTGCVVTDLSGNSAVTGISAQQVLDCVVTSVVSTSNVATGISAGSTSRCRVQTVSGSTQAYGIRGPVAPTLVSHCSVSGVTCSGGSAYGIAAQDVSGCAVSATTGLSSATGISAPNDGAIHSCTVQGTLVTGAAGPVTGIEAIQVSQCVVRQTGTSSGGVPIGISAKVVTECQVTGVGGASSSNSGIGFGIFAQTVAGCHADTIGAPGCPCSLTAIRGLTTAHSRASNILGTGSLAGIEGNVVTASSVQTLSGSSTGSITGIAAGRVENCEVYGLSGTAGFGVVGIIAGQVSGSRVVDVADTGTLPAAGIRAKGSGCTIANCHVQGTSHIGIDAVDVGVVVRDCHVQGDLNFGLGPLGTVGIQANAPNGHVRIEGNHVSNFATGITASSNRAILVVRNSVGTCTTNFNVGANAQFGPIVTTGGALTTATPWANFVD